MTLGHSTHYANAAKLHIWSPMAQLGLLLCRLGLCIGKCNLVTRVYQSLGVEIGWLRTGTKGVAINRYVVLPPQTE